MTEVVPNIRTLPMPRPRQSGFTLVELIIFIVVVAVGMVGILKVMDVTVARSADPMVRKQAIALADSILEEVMLKAYVDPDTVPGVEASRDLYDDVSDYAGINETLSAAGPIFTGFPSTLYGYRVQVAVAPATLGTIAAKSVAVTVSRGPDSITLTGYRTAY